MSKFTSAILEYVYGIATTNMGVSSCFFYPKPSNIFNLAVPEQVLDFEQFLSLIRKNGNCDIITFDDDNFNELDAIAFINANFEIVDNAKHFSIFNQFSENTLLIRYYDQNPIGLVTATLLFFHIGKNACGEQKTTRSHC